MPRTTNTLPATAYAGPPRLRSERPAIQDVLVVDQQRSDCRRLTGTLKFVLGHGLRVRTVHSFVAALDAVADTCPDLLLTNPSIGGWNDITVDLPLFRRAGFGGPVVVVSGDFGPLGGPLSASQLKSAGIAATLHKDEFYGAELAAVLGSISWQRRPKPDGEAGELN